MARTVLIVDDVILNRMVLGNMLGADYTVLEAGNGKEALSLLHSEQRRISAVLLDLLMPVMDGYELLEKMRDNPALSPIPVIVTTGSSDLDAEKKALALGANDFVQKPYDPDILKKRLENLVALRETSAIVKDDRLTGLFNREAFFEKAVELIKTKPAGNYIIACVDIDNFKVINDLYGSDTGDRVLITLAQTLLDSCTEDDGVCGRISADNFVTLRTRSFAEHSADIADVIAAGILEKTGIGVTLSLGCYYVDDLSLDVSAMYDRAKMAQRSVKGRSDVTMAVFDESMRDSIIREQRIVDDMRAALSEGQFEAWFQPQYNHETGSCIGAEALVRWRHPERGLVSPGEFIPIFEQNGFIYELDKYVWEQVCRLLCKWLDEGRHPLPVSVNISRQDFFRPELTDILTGLIKKYRLTPDLLRLEITESAFSDDADVIISTIKELIGLGFTVEIDDFGSGYSSLNTLKDVPAQILKLDMRFFENSENSERGGNIIESVVRMAKWLGMSIIAEGVEDKKRADYLLSIGCRYIQGYLYAKPMPAAEYEASFNAGGKEHRLIELETVENMDNFSFWDPESLDTVIFNSYAGAACVVEAAGDKIEIIRATGLFAGLFGAETTVNDVLQEDWIAHMDGDSMHRISAALHESAEKNTAVTVELVFLDLPHCPHKTYISTNMRVIAVIGDRRLVYCINENITAQREAENRINAFAEQMRTLMNDTPGAFARMRIMPDGKLSTVFVNETLCRMRGMTVEEIVGADTENAMVAIHPDDVEMARAAVMHMLKTGEMVQTKYRLRHADGHYMTLGVYGRVTADSLGNRYVNIYYTDLSLGDKKDFTIREATPRILSVIMESSNDFAFAKDKDFRYLCCSAAFLRLAGLNSESEALGKTDFDLFPQDLAEQFRKNDVALLADGKPMVDFDEIIRDAKGETHYCLASKHILRDAEGEVIGIYGVSRDITAEHTASEQLKLITDSVPGGLARYKASPQGLEIVYYNDGFCRLAGTTREEYEAMSGSGVESHIHPDDAAELMRQVNELIKNGTPVNCTYRGEKLDGSGYAWINLHGVLSERHGDTCYMNAVLYDVSAQKEAELQASVLAAQLKTIVDHAASGITAVRINPDGSTEALFMTEKFFELLGYTREQYFAELPSHYMFIHPDDVDRVKVITHGFALTEKAVPLDFRAIRRDGRVIWLHVDTSIIRFSDDGRPVQLAVFTDITDTMAARQNELQTAQRMSIIMEHAGVGIRAATVRGDDIEYLFVNDEFFRVLGYTREQYNAEVTDRYSVIVPADREWVKREMCAAAEVGDSKTLEFRVVTRNGETRWIRVDITVAQFEGVELPVQLYVHMDITAEKEKSMQDRVLLENLPSVAGIYEMKDGVLSLVYLNRGLRELVGTKSEQLHYDQPLSDIHPDDAQLLRQEIEAALKDGQDIQCDIRLCHASEGYIPVHAAGRIVPNGTDSYIIYATFTPNDPDMVIYQEMLPRLLSEAMRDSKDYAFIKDSEYRYSFCSAGLLTLTGLADEDEVIGRTDFDIFPREVAENFRQRDRALMGGGPSKVAYDDSIRLPDGTHYLNTSKFVLHDSNGKPAGIYGISRDITEVRELQSRLKLVTDSIPGGIAVYSGRPDALDRIRLSYFSDGFCRLFGYTREEYEKLAAVNPLGLVFEPDLAGMFDKVKALVRDGEPMDYIYRARSKNGSLIWVNVKAVKGSTAEAGELTVNAVFFDVTELRSTLEKLRVSEEANRLAIEHSGRVICRYDIESRSLLLPESLPAKFALERVLRDVPQSQIDAGEISPETADAYIALYSGIIDGKQSGTCTYQRKTTEGWRWIEAKYTTLFSSDKKPVSAVLSFSDVTEQRDKENIYLKWKSSFSQRAEDSFTLFRCNLTQKYGFGSREGTLLPINEEAYRKTFNESIDLFVRDCVFADDREAFRAFSNSDTMVAEYYRGHRVDKIEFRCCMGNDRLRWLRLSVELVEYPDTNEVEAFMLFEDIDDVKRAELKTLELSQTDPLTGVLNRTTFVARVDRILKTSRPGTTHALLMLDIDGFKQVNDVFGHDAGDKILIDVAKGLCTMVRDSDLVARLGGDEFMLFLSGIADEEAAMAKGRQICRLARKSLSLEVHVSGSVGIAFAPRDGNVFQSLYAKADAALYHVKGLGKNNVAAYSADMGDGHIAGETRDPETDNADATGRKLRMLIVDDNSIDYTMLENIFKDDFIIENAKDGNAALVRLRHYGNAVSVVLLDLMMPGIDGFMVLKKMLESEQMRTIPVIVVSGDESRESCLRAIRSGAADFVTKPVDPDILRIRVRSAISRAENERLRAHNALLDVQSEERIRYDYVLERVGITFIEYNWLSKEFTYYPSVSMYLAGTYDTRPFWQILLSDMVADTDTVQQMQQLVHRVATDSEKMGGTINVKLKTPQGGVHGFRMNVHKQVNNFQLTNKLMITLTDLDYKVE